MNDTLVGIFTNTPQDDRITIISHGLLNGDQVRFVLTDPENVLPFPLNDADYYFVVNARGNDFMVSSTSGGPVINITDKGTGANQVWKRGEDTGGGEGGDELSDHQMSSTVTHACTTDDYMRLKVGHNPTL